MIKFAIGILIGGAMAALAQGGSKMPDQSDFWDQRNVIQGMVLPASGVNPRGNADIIRVDDKGRVYCSPEQLQ